MISTAILWGIDFENLSITVEPGHNGVTCGGFVKMHPHACFCSKRSQMGLSHKLYFGQHSRKLEIPVIFSRNDFFFWQNTLFNMYTVKKWENPNFQKHPSHCFCLVAPNNICFWVNWFHACSLSTDWKLTKKGPKMIKILKKKTGQKVARFSHDHIFKGFWVKRCDLLLVQRRQT